MLLNLRAYGEDLSGCPVVVLHGLFGSLDNWHSVSLRLAGRFPVLAVDLRNHGHSPHDPAMSYPLMARDLHELLLTRGIARARLLGHSMGAKTAMQFALLYPEKVDRLIAVDMAPRAYSPRHERILAGLSGLNPGDFQTRQRMEAALAPAIPDLALRRFLLKNAVPVAGGGYRWRIGLESIRANYPQLSAALSGEQPFRGPALFLRGGRSDYLREDDLPAIRRLFPQAQLRAVPDAGHLVHIENPDAFLREVITFFE